MMKEVCLDFLLLWSSACGIRMQIGNLNNISCTWNLPFYFGEVFGEVNFFHLGSREKIPMIGDSHPVTNIYFHWIHGLSLWAKSQPYFSTWCHIAQTIDFRIHPRFITYDFIYLSMAHKKISLLHEYFIYVAIIFVRFNSQQKKLCKLLDGLKLLTSCIDIFKFLCDWLSFDWILLIHFDGGLVYAPPYKFATNSNGNDCTNSSLGPNE